jgi:hypothetical protein
MPCVTDTLWTRTASTNYGGFVAVDGAGRTTVATAVGGSIDWGTGPINAISGVSALLMSFDAAGNLAWDKVWGVNQSFATAIAVDPLGNVIVGGRAWGPVDYGGGPLGAQGEMRCFVVKLTPAGAHVWSRITQCLEGIKSIAADAFGNVIVAGISVSPVDFGPGPLPHSMGGWDTFVVKFDPAGNQLWGKDYGKDFAQGSYWAVTSVDPSGDVFLTGSHTTYDFGGGPVTGNYFVTKLLPLVEGRHGAERHPARDRAGPLGRRRVCHLLPGQRRRGSGPVPGAVRELPRAVRFER